MLDKNKVELVSFKEVMQIPKFERIRKKFRSRLMKI